MPAKKTRTKREVEEPKKEEPKKEEPKEEPKKEEPKKEEPKKKEEIVSEPKRKPAYHRKLQKQK